MGKNEIRLRKDRISTGRIIRHRNYSEIMRIHDREIRLKRVLRVFTYFLIILFIIILLLIIWRWEKRWQQKNSTPETKVLKGLHQTFRADFRALNYRLPCKTLR